MKVMLSRNKIARKQILFDMFFMCSLLFFALLLPSLFIEKHNTNAEEVGLDLSIGEVIALSVDGAINMDLTPTVDGNYSESDINVIISTNSAAGYAATISSKTNETALVDARRSNFKIETIPQDGVTAANFPVNRYGYGVKTGSTLFKAIKTPASADTFKTANAPTLADQVTLSFATKIDQSAQSGAYSNTIVISAVTGYVEAEIDHDIYFLGTDNPFAFQRDGVTYTDDDIMQQALDKIGFVMPATSSSGLLRIDQINAFMDQIYGDNIAPLLNLSTLAQDPYYVDPSVDVLLTDIPSVFSNDPSVLNRYYFDNSHDQPSQHSVAFLCYDKFQKSGVMPMPYCLNYAVNFFYRSRTREFPGSSYDGAFYQAWTGWLDNSQSAGSTTGRIPDFEYIDGPLNKPWHTGLWSKSYDVGMTDVSIRASMYPTNQVSKIGQTLIGGFGSNKGRYTYIKRTSTGEKDENGSNIYITEYSPDYIEFGGEGIAGGMTISVFELALDVMGFKLSDNVGNFQVKPEDFRPIHTDTNGCSNEFSDINDEFVVCFDDNWDSGHVENRAAPIKNKTEFMFYIPKYTPERPGHNFLGWSTNPDGPVQYTYGYHTDGEGNRLDRVTVTPASPKLHLYAIWD